MLKGFKLEIKLFLLVALIAVVVSIAGILFLLPLLKIDKCFDNGGRWDYESNHCVGIITSSYHEVILYVYEKDGSHIFDGAVIAAIDENGEIVREQVADHDGKVVFNLPVGKYRLNLN